jgi:hypothetical protein
MGEERAQVPRWKWVKMNRRLFLEVKMKLVNPSIIGLACHITLLGDAAKVH